MSSVPINAAKARQDVPARAAASPRGTDDASPADAFAAALGAATPSFRTMHEHPPAGSDDAASGNARAGDAHAPDASDHAKAAPLLGTVPGDTEKTMVVSPGLRVWSGQPNAPTPGRQRGPTAPTAADAALDAAAVAATLVAPTAQPADTPDLSGAKSPDRGSSIPRGAGLPGPVSADPQRLVAGLPAQADKAGPVAAGSGIEPAPAKSHFASIDAGAATDAGIGPAPSRLMGGDPTALPAGSTGDPSTMAANLFVPPLIHAAETPAQITQFNTVALTAAVPAAAVAALTNTVSTGGHDSRDSSGRDDRNADLAAFGGVGAATDTGTTGATSAASASSGITSAASGVTGGADAGVANQLSGQVIRLLANSGHEAVVRLHPPDLGEVTVRVAVSGRDVSAWFGASQPAVQQTISLGLGQLHADLGNAGYNLSGTWVGADTSGFGARDGSAQQRPTIPPAIAAASPVPIGAPAGRSSNAGVSIYV